MRSTSTSEQAAVTHQPMAGDDPTLQTSASTDVTGSGSGSGRFREHVVTPPVSAPDTLLPTDTEAGGLVSKPRSGEAGKVKKQRITKESKGSFDLGEHITRHFGQAPQDLVQLAICIKPLLKKPIAGRGGQGDIGQCLLAASLETDAVARDRALVKLKRHCTALLSGTGIADGAQVDQKQLVSVIWWCDVLADEMTALSALQVAPKAALCQVAREICMGPIFAAETDFLSHRVALIYRHAAEHGNSHALQWLIERCLLDERGGLMGFTLDEGFNWLRIYRQLVVDGTLTAPEGSDTIAKLVRGGRDFCQGAGDVTVIERLLTVGLCLDYRFGKVDKSRAHKLLNQVLTESPLESGSRLGLSNYELSVAWLWQAILALPYPYSTAVAEPEPEPDVETCLEQAEQFGNRDATVYRLQLAVQGVECNRPGSVSTLKQRIKEQRTCAPESMPPMYWGVLNAALINLTSTSGKEALQVAKDGKNGAKAKYYRRELASLESLIQLVQQGLYSAACHGNPEVRGIWLAEHLGNLYYDYRHGIHGRETADDSGPSPKKTNKTVIACRQLLKLLQFTNVDSQICVYQSGGNGVPGLLEQAVDYGTSPEESDGERTRKTKMARALELDPIRGPLTLGILSLPIYPFTLPELGGKVCAHLLDLTDFQLFLLMGLNRIVHVLTIQTQAARRLEVGYECQYRVVSSSLTALQLQHALLLVGLEDKARRLWQAAPVSIGRSGYGPMVTGAEIEAGQYECYHQQRCDRYDLLAWAAIPLDETREHLQQSLINLLVQLDKSMELCARCPLAAWRVGYQINYLITAYYPLISCDHLRALTDAYVKAIGLYKAAADRAEQQLVNMVLKMIDACTCPEPSWRDRMLALVNGQLNQDQACGSIDPDTLVLPQAHSYLATRRDFLNLDKTDALALKRYLQNIRFQEDGQPDNVCPNDIPELLHWLCKRLVSEQGPSQPVVGAVEPALVAPIVMLAEWAIKESKSYCHGYIGKSLFSLQVVGELNPAFFPIKRNLWHRVGEALGYQQERQWRLEEYNDKDIDSKRRSRLCSNNQNYQIFSRYVYDCSTPERLVVKLVETFNTCLPEFMHRVVSIWGMSPEQRQALLETIEITHQQQDEKTVQRCKILCKCINKQFDNELWKAITRIQVSKSYNYYPFVLAMITTDCAFQDKLTDREVESLFQPLASRGDANIWFYAYRWLYRKGRLKEAGQYLYKGQQGGSHLCLLEQARAARVAGLHGKAKMLYHEIAPKAVEKLGYTNAQYDLGELYAELTTFANTYEQAYQHWVKACYYHHPLALCRLFTCLYPDPEADNKWCPDQKVRWHSHSLLTDALELPTHQSSAGRELCWQLMRWHDTKSCDQDRLVTASSRLTIQETLILAQLPASCWPDLCQSLPAHLRQRAVELIAQYRCHPGQEASYLVEGIAIRALSYYPEIAGQLEVSQPVSVGDQESEESETASITTEPETLEDTQEVLAQADSEEEPHIGQEPETNPAAEEPSDEHAQARAQPGLYLQQALTGKSKRLALRAVQVLYEVHGDDLLHCLKANKQRLDAAQWLFIEGHGKLATRLLQQGIQEVRVTAKAQLLFKLLKNSITLDIAPMTNRVMTELADHVHWKQQLLREQQLEEITDLFIKGAFRQISPQRCGKVVAQLMARVPQYWQRRLLQEMVAGKNLSHLSNPAGHTGVPGDHTHVLTLLDHCAPHTEVALMKASIGQRELAIHYRKGLADRLPEQELATLDGSILHQLAELAIQEKKPGCCFAVLKKHFPQCAYQLLADKSLPGLIEESSYKLHLADLWRTSPPAKEHLPGIVANREAYARHTCKSWSSKAVVQRKITQLKAKDLIGLCMAIERLKDYEPHVDRQDPACYDSLCVQKKQLIDEYLTMAAATSYEQALQIYYAQSLREPQ